MTATMMVTSARKVGVLLLQIWSSFEHIPQQLQTYIKKLIMKKIVDKKEVRYAAGALGCGIMLYGLYKLYMYVRTVEPSSSIMSQSFDANEADISRQTSSFISQSNQHNPYDILIEDPLRDKLGESTVSTKGYLKQINYKVILSLMKGNSYQGIVNIHFYIEMLPQGQEYLKLNFRGSGIKYLMVNGKVLEPKEFQYLHHHILIPRSMVKEKGNNGIQVIFQNFYSFLDQGMSTYFMVDQHQKYSLRHQVVYSVNGYLDIEKMIPCFNCLNQCKVQIEVIHSDTFEVFSNTSKSLERLCSAAQYQKYPFLFDLTSSTLNKSFKMTESTLSKYSGIQNTLSGSYSSVNYYNRKKANSHFYKQRLPCIHHLFIFSSTVVEMQPSVANHPLESQVLLRYFCKHTESNRLVKNVNQVHGYILDVFRRLGGKINKIDILIIADRSVEGYFAPGVLLLSEESLKENTLAIRCFYLIVRGLVGILFLERGYKLVSLQDLLELNMSVFEKFEEFRNYLFIKNKKFQRLTKLIKNPEGTKFIEKYQGHFMRYYSKELRFIILENINEKLTYELDHLMLTFQPENSQEFWQKLIKNYNFLPPLIIEPLIKLTLRNMEVPSNERLREQLKACFSGSKYVLNFYSNQQISDNLPKFIEVEAYGLQQRLTQVKVKQKFKDYITEKYEMYLPIRSNTSQAENSYNQLKHFNESKNFHHYSVLKSEINRISYFGKQFITHERVPVSCGIMGWKILKKIELYPRDEEYYQMIRFLEGLS